MVDIYIVENIRFRTHQTDAKKLVYFLVFSLFSFLFFSLFLLTYQNMVGN